MTTPDEPTTAETNRQTIADDGSTTRPDRTSTDTNRASTGTERTASDPRTTSDPSPRRIPGRTPVTEEAGAPLVPPIGTDATERSTTADLFETPRRPSPPPTDAERDAPLVPDLRPTRRPRTDGGSR